MGLKKERALGVGHRWREAVSRIELGVVVVPEGEGGWIRIHHRAVLACALMPHMPDRVPSILSWSLALVPHVKLQGFAFACLLFLDRNNKRMASKRAWVF